MFYYFVGVIRFIF